MLLVPDDGKTTVSVSTAIVAGTFLADTRPILEDDMILSGRPRMPETWPKTQCEAKRDSDIRRIRRDIPMSFLPAGRDFLDRLGAGRNLKIIHRILSVHIDI